MGCAPAILVSCILDRLVWGIFARGGFLGSAAADVMRFLPQRLNVAATKEVELAGDTLVDGLLGFGNVGPKDEELNMEEEP